ncbi:MAG TPA: hypothetical protein VJ901_02990 [Thermoanaerobaculia bacterium]|nr:hypothetical protein [Thermoanaerobaculia bacterium]
MIVPQWDIRREGREWAGDECYARFDLTPERFEMADGKLFWSDEQRITLLALLLENVGIDAALRLAPLDLWRESLDAAEQKAT